GWISHDSPLPEPAGHLVAAGNGIRAAKRGRPYRRSASAPRRPGETRAARRERATEDRCRGHGAGSAEGGGGYPAACPLHHCRNQHPQAAPEQLPLRRSRRIPDVARFPSVRRPPGYPDRGDAPGRIDHGCGIHQRIEMVKKRVRQWLDACPAWLRLQVFSNYVRLTGRPVDVDLLRGIAVELERQGRTRALERAWALISTLDPPTPGGLDYRLTLAAHAGRVAEVRWLLARLRQEVGLPPGRLLWLAGTLAAAGHPREARTILASVQGGAEGIRRLLRQSPSIVSGHLPADLDALLDSLQAGGSDQALLQLARMCFTVRRLDAACRLYRLVHDRPGLQPEDRVAMLYAACRNEHPTLAGDVDMPAGGEWTQLDDALAERPDALAMLAYAALAKRQDALAWPLLERAIRAKYAGIPELPALLDECRAMAAAIPALRELPDELPATLLEPCIPGNAGVRKVFICGFGWSGSGAVYDDVRDAVGFAEFEGAGNGSAILNEDSDTEATFIQTTAGLGEWWASAKRQGRIPWHRAWDMLCLHVLGLSGIGYDNHKCCAAAENNLRRFGMRYVRPFRRFLEDVLRLRQS